ncbi:MAG: Rid family detoxifying hydrolase [Spirochaetaceae bacterium]|jgi:2-iminobutanoate/2-iminopropanoate deaminase|nr:Rid family detoxifying hydrolase [Spirochaetaceae bacterium]
MTRKAIVPPGVKSVGPYSAGIDAEGLVFLSGQTPLDPATGKLAEGGIGAQTEQCFKNLFAVLAAGNLGPGDVVKVTVFLTNMTDFAAMNEVYKNQFSEPYPARSTIGVAALPLGAAVEIEFIARRR